MSDHIVVKGDKAPVIYKYTRDTPGQIVPGVAARDLDAYDLASYDPGQRFAIKMEADRDGGAYKLVGTVPRGLSFEPEYVEPQPDAEPAAEPATKTGKKG
jgi:hypothetical protein